MVTLIKFLVVFIVLLFSHPSLLNPPPLSDSFFLSLRNSLFSVFLNGYDPKWMNKTIKFLHVPNLFSSCFLPPSDTNYVSYLLPPSPYITFLALKLFLFLSSTSTHDPSSLSLINHWNRLWKMLLFTTKETEHYFFLPPLFLLLFFLLFFFSFI